MTESKPDWLDKVLRDFHGWTNQLDDYEQFEINTAKQAITAKLSELLDSFSEIIGPNLGTERLTSQRLIDARMSQNQLREDLRHQLAHLKERWLEGLGGEGK